MSLESIKEVNKVAHVSPIKKYFPHIAAVVILVMAFIILMPSHKSQQKNAQSQKSHLNSQTLANNLNALKAMRSHEETPLEPQESFSDEPHVNFQANRVMLAKQNAPTLLYHRKIEVPASSGATLNSAQTTLADGSSYATFANSATIAKSVSAQKLAHTGYTIAGGEFIHATLETAINSNLPGMVRAIVSRPVYSYTGERIIIPAGSRLIGQYASNTLRGINRVFVIWNRVILPHGITAELNSPGTDPLGTAGQGADVYNTHFWQRFGNAALLSVIGASTATVGVNANEQYNPASQYRTAMAESFQQASQNSLKQSANIKPTLRIYQGASINVFISKDISFFGVMHEG